MNTIASLAIFLFLIALSIWGVVLTVRRRAPDRTYLAAVAVGEIELVLQALAAVIVIAGGHRPPEIAEYFGYLFVTVALVPYALVRARSPHATFWDSSVVAIVTFAVAIAVLRLLALW